MRAPVGLKVVLKIWEESCVGREGKWLVGAGGGGMVGGVGTFARSSMRCREGRTEGMLGGDGGDGGGDDVVDWWVSSDDGGGEVVMGRAQRWMPIQLVTNNCNLRPIECRCCFAPRKRERELRDRLCLFLSFPLGARMSNVSSPPNFFTNRKVASLALSGNISTRHCRFS